MNKYAYGIQGKDQHGCCKGKSFFNIQDSSEGVRKCTARKSQLTIFTGRYKKISSHRRKGRQKYLQLSNQLPFGNNFK